MATDLVDKLSSRLSRDRWTVCIRSQPVTRFAATLLGSDELSLVSSASDVRIREFSAGRETARDALEALGLPRQPILQGKHRQPIWPKSVVGSITHTREWAVVAVAWANNVRCLGIDLESGTVPENATELVVHENELSGETTPAAVFSCKEAVYKSVFSQHLEYFDFLDIRLSFGPSPGRFSAVACRALSSQVSIKRGIGYFVGRGPTWLSAFVVGNS